MVRYTLDSETSRHLGEATQAVQLCDHAGKVIGVFFPEKGGRGLPPPGLTSSLSAEEIEQRRSTRTGRTLDEILRTVEPR